MTEKDCHDSRARSNAGRRMLRKGKEGLEGGKSASQEAQDQERGLLQGMTRGGGQTRNVPLLYIRSDRFGHILVHDLHTERIFS